jgi:metal-sulfur cluster biosynthetic enzyme
MTEADVRAALLGVIDPEFGVNIVDLGLVYQVAIDAGTVRITMTMTSLSCPLRYYLQDVIESTVMLCLSGAARVIVDIVSNPPWTREMMSPAARAQLGVLCGSQREL